MVDLLIVTHQQTTGTEGQQRGGWVGGWGGGGSEGWGRLLEPLQTFVVRMFCPQTRFAPSLPG